MSCCDHHSHHHHHGEDGVSRAQVLRLAAGGLLFAVGLMSSPQGEMYRYIFVASYIILGGGVVWEALRSLLRRDVFNEHFLMSVATIGAFVIGEYPEGVAVMLFYLVGELLQDVAVGRSRTSIRSLMDIRPEQANVLRDGRLQLIPAAEVQPGDAMLVSPGERVALDGRIVEGTSMADTSALTGESLPRLLSPGDEVLSGFINLSESLTVQVERDFENSAVSRILHLVEHASSRKAPVEQFISRFARVYTPAVVFAALLLAFVPPLLISGATLAEWGYRALVLLVISCPCALVLAIPLSFFGGIGGASRQGILVKGSQYLEALAEVDTVVFDKTGTLTQGLFQVTDIRPADGFSDEEVLEYAAYAESRSTHPIALSILKRYEGTIEHGRIERYEERPGHGVRIRMDGRDIVAGSRRWLVENEVAMPEFPESGTTVLLAIEGAYAGRIDVADALKEDAQEALTQLKELGIRKTAMLSGDTQAAADRVAEALGIDEVHAGLLPEQKVERMEALSKAHTAGHRIAFVGDGINDAPVLAVADIGIAMGGLGSDAAIEASDVVLMTDEPSKVALAIRLARRTQRIVMQNVWFILAVKALFLLLGAMGIASMWGAVFADVGVTLLAVLNALRALRVKPLET